MNGLPAYTAWKVSKYGVFSGPYLETFHWELGLMHRRYDKDVEVNKIMKLFCRKRSAG